MALKKYRNFCQVTHLSVSFLLLYIACNPTSILQSHIMKSFGYGELGFYNIAVLFLCHAIGSFFSTATINKMGIKFGLVVGGVLKSLWVLACVVPAYGAISEDKDYWLYSKSFIYPF